MCSIHSICLARIWCSPNPRGVRPGSHRLWRTTRLRSPGNPRPWKYRWTAECSRNTHCNPEIPRRGISNRNHTPLFVVPIHLGAKLVDMSLLELADFSHFCWENQHQITGSNPHKVLSSGGKLAYKYQPNQPNQPNYGYSAMVTINPVRFVCEPTNGSFQVAQLALVQFQPTSWRYISPYSSRGLISQLMGIRIPEWVINTTFIKYH
jgi:hypothetical protein